MTDIENTLQHYHRLADICLRTTTTMFAIVFSIIFGMWSNIGKLGYHFKIGLLLLGIGFIIEVLVCILALYGNRAEDIRYVELLAKISIILLFLIILGMVAILSALLFI